MQPTGHIWWGLSYLYNQFMARLGQPKRSSGFILKSLRFGDLYYIEMFFFYIGII